MGSLNTLNQPPVVAAKPTSIPPPFQLSLEQIRQIKNIYADTPLMTSNLNYNDKTRYIDIVRYFDKEAYLNFIASNDFPEHTSLIDSDQIDGSLFGRHTENRILGNPFQLTINYLNKFHKDKKDPIKYFDSVTVIGDSLSDSEGKMYKKSRGLLTRANQYYKGRFTNGGTWAEFLTMPSIMQSNQYCMGRTKEPSVKLTNKAEGGSPSATYLKPTLDPKFAILSNMEKQVKNLTFDEKNLGIIFLGANDYMTYSKTDIDFVIADQKRNIEKMIANGARNLVIMGIPDLSLTPATKKLPPEKRKRLQKISVEHNKKLQEMVDILTVQQLCQIKFFNVNEVFCKIINTTNAINAKEPGSYEVNKAFSDGYIRRDNKPLEIDPHYLFIDDVHPTQEVHMIIATELHQFISDKFKPLT